MDALELLLEIVKEVKIMRKLQIDYFRASWEEKKNIIGPAKAQEKKVDKLINKFENDG